LKDFPFKDIIHFILFKIIENKMDIINKTPNLQSILIDFILKNKNDLAIPYETKKKINKISLHFINNLIKNIDMKGIKDKKIKENI